MGKCFAGTARRSGNRTSIDVEVEELFLDATYEVVLTSTVCKLFPRRFTSDGIGEIIRNLAATPIIT